jgi:hypothetical protein
VVEPARAEKDRMSSSWARGWSHRGKEAKSAVEEAPSASPSVDEKPVVATEIPEKTVAATTVERSNFVENIATTHVDRKASAADVAERNSDVDIEKGLSPADGEKRVNSHSLRRSSRRR